MESPEEVSLGAKDQTQIVKGKRTKRVRPQSPSPLSATSKTEDQDQDEDTKNSATTTSAEFEANPIGNNGSRSSTTEEEEDMANCLILLAQGQSRDSKKLAEEDCNTMMMMKSNNNNNNSNYKYNYKSSRKFMEAATMGANNAGFYVYECKTCNKTFPSFQALGGHRASHKKPKTSPPMAAITDKQKKKEEDFILHRNNNNNTLSFQFLNSGSNGNKNKVHECSICGAEFGSGQALGGHMRRHRAPVGTKTTTINTTSLALNNNPMGLEADQYHNEDHHRQPRKKRHILSLDLDLNLPAPQDDQTDSSSFTFEPEQQQQASLVFSSAPDLVDCHY